MQKLNIYKSIINFLRIRKYENIISHASFGKEEEEVKYSCQEFEAINFDWISAREANVKRENQQKLQFIRLHFT